MEFTPLSLLYDFCIMSLLLFIGKVMRSKVRFFQNMYIPSALIAGILGVIGGPYGLKIIPFSEYASSYSGILIAVLFATLYLGKSQKASFKEMFGKVGDTFLINTASEVGQYGLFILIGVFVIHVFFKETSPYFSVMLPSGFVGGHGTAVAIGTVFESNGWSEAITIGQTFATIGLLSGIFGGVAIINYCTRKNYTKVIKKLEEMPEDMRTGLIEKENRTVLGENTVSPMSIDPLTWHLSLILLSVGIAYLVNNLILKIFPGLSIPIYGLALIAGVFIQKLTGILKLQPYIDGDIISRMGSSVTDYLVGFGVATINLNVVLKYWLPICILSVLGILYVVLYFFIISKKLFRNYWVERGIYIFGWSTGVMSIAVLLLRIVDPEFKTGILEDSGFAWIFISFIDLVCVTFIPIFLLRGLFIQTGLVLVILAVGCLLLCRIKYGSFKGDGSAYRPGEKEWK